jgi:hypothetical protein
MPEKSPITFLIGQLNSVPYSGALADCDPLYQFGPALSALGASQPPPDPQTSTSKDDTSTRATFLPRDLTVAKPLVSAAFHSRSSRLRALQIWEGTVIAVDTERFRAKLADITDPSKPDEQAVFEIGEVAQDDVAFVQPGSSFYWTIGTERTPGGQQKNTSLLQFRRLPLWNRSAIAKTEERARRTKELFESVP